ncbi:hypothetical protein [Streptomyces canus]|uniref:hypothetical protein n=1 Tax=Streptomyces canus TaxID=58343 RepID=UPI0009A0D9FF|nr:hypothetical protein [Streptomyces canus]
MVNVAKIGMWAKTFLDLVGGPVLGLMLLSLGIRNYLDGGSIGWPIAGSVVFLINLRVAWRRLVELRKPTAAE